MRDALDLLLARAAIRWHPLAQWFCFWSLIRSGRSPRVALLLAKGLRKPGAAR